MNDLAKKLKALVARAPHWVEVRYHKRFSQGLQVTKGLVKQARATTTSGIGLRVLVDGAWGFSATSTFTDKSLDQMLKRAIEGAKSISQLKKAKVTLSPSKNLAKGMFSLPGYAELLKMPLEAKLDSVLKTEDTTRKQSKLIRNSTCAYQELFEDKIILTTDGADAISQLARNEIRLSAVAEKNGSLSEGHETTGKTGSWECLFKGHSLNQMSETAAKLATDLLEAKRAPGGLKTLILSPGMVGLLCHEAIGHTVEADFVLSGSVAKGKLGTKVASSLVTLCDSGVIKSTPNGGGDLLVDDEGILTQRTEIIKNGVLNSYLHNRESAALFGVEPTGNARAWLYNDEPLIRMRNTYLEPGEMSLDEMIASTQDGYLLDGPLGGQADATGEFMFGAQKVQRIENGKIVETLKGATISGQAFEVLSTVDAVSKEFALDLGSGYCGKGQPAKVDAGGPWIRCKALIGGTQGE